MFVCTNRRPLGGRPSCGTRGGTELADALRREIAARPQLWDKVAVTECECLGPCFDGPNLVVYPDSVWYCGASAADAGELTESHLAAGQPVERLVYSVDDNDED